MPRKIDPKKQLNMVEAFRQLHSIIDLVTERSADETVVLLSDLSDRAKSAGLPLNIDITGSQLLQTDLTLQPEFSEGPEFSEASSY